MQVRPGRVAGLADEPDGLPRRQLRAAATTVGSRYARWQYVQTRPSVVAIVKPMPQLPLGSL